VDRGSNKEMANRYRNIRAIGHFFAMHRPKRWRS